MSAGVAPEAEKVCVALADAAIASAAIALVIITGYSGMNPWLILPVTAILFREVFVSGGAGELALCKYQYPPERSLKDPQTGEAKGVAGTVEELNKAKIGDQPVNSLDWNKSREGLLACSAFDQSLRIMLVTKLSLV